jgi:hypothetical protein
MGLVLYWVLAGLAFLGVQRGIVSCHHFSCCKPSMQEPTNKSSIIRTCVGFSASRELRTLKSLHWEYLSHLVSDFHFLSQQKMLGWKPSVSKHWHRTHQVEHKSCHGHPVVDKERSYSWWYLPLFSTRACSSDRWKLLYLLAQFLGKQRMKRRWWRES